MKLRPYIGWIVGYLVLIALIVWGFQQAYNWGTGAFSSTTEKKNWQEWRKTVVKQNKEQGPVERRVPKSEEPPLLVLMRDHYSTCLVGALIFASAIYVSLVFMIRGVASGKSFEVAEDDLDVIRNAKP